MEKDDCAGGMKIGFFADKWRLLYVLEILFSTFRRRLIHKMNVNIKSAPGRRCASENQSCYIYRPWTVHRLRHRKGDPLCVAIVQDTSLDMGISGLLKVTYYAIQEDKSLKRPEGFNEPEIDIKGIKNNCSFRNVSANQNVQTGLSSSNFWW